MESLECQNLKRENFEVIIVDDGSTDDTLKKAQQFKTDMRLIVKNLNVNSGPGVARNAGLAVSKGKYVVFLDGDDLLFPYSLARLSELVQGQNYDLVTFNWTFFSDLKVAKEVVPRRRDLEKMPTHREAMVPHYLGMNMDGSVIYTMAKKTLFTDFNIRFPKGYHEDMSVIFQLYYGARKIKKLDEVLYVKRNAQGSIVNTLSKKHVTGYLNAWPEIAKFLENQGVSFHSYRESYLRGMSGHVYTLVNKNYKIYHDDPRQRQKFYRFILEALDGDVNLMKPYSDYFPRESKKDEITHLFLFHMSKEELPYSDRVKCFESDLLFKQEVE